MSGLWRALPVVLLNFWFLGQVDETQPIYAICDFLPTYFDVLDAELLGLE